MTYTAGWAKQELNIKPKNYAMHGYGFWKNRAKGEQSTLYARALYIEDNAGQALMYCCFDMGYVTHAIRSGIERELQEMLGDAFNPAHLVLTCTHTHSGPGGVAQEAMYNVVTPGFLPEHLNQVIEAGSNALMTAKAQAKPTDLSLSCGRFDDDIAVAWNRSLEAYNANPDVTPLKDTQTHLALDRNMNVLSFRQDEQLVSMLSLFGVHATCVGNKNTKYDGDNKGYATAKADALLTAQGVDNPSCIFAQGVAGDISPHYQGPNDIAKRKKIKGDAEFDYAKQNGELQTDLAFDLAKPEHETKIGGGIDAILTYIDFSNLKANPKYASGNDSAFTSPPCHGVSFFEGTRVDGPGMPKFLGFFARKQAKALRAKRLKQLDKLPKAQQDYLKRMYTAQGIKDVLMEDETKQALGYDLDKIPLPGFVDPILGELKRQAKLGAMKNSPLVPRVLPLQIITIGQVALVCCPGEFTTISGKRIQASLEKILANKGIAHVIMHTYCNDYMGYVTTQEEYDKQCYEAGHTVYGKWTHAAFQTELVNLAKTFNKPKSERDHDTTTRPHPIPEDELKLRTDVPAPK